MIRHMGRVRSLVMILACMALLGACADDDGPVKIYQYGAIGGAATDLGMRTVAEGDTPYTIGKAYDISAEDIIAVNHLSPPYRLTPGQRLRIPPPSRYTAHAGDTLYSVSRTFNVSETQIARLNHLQPPYRLPPGKNLRLPSVLPPENAGSITAGSITVAGTATGETSGTGVYNPPPPEIHYYTPPDKKTATPAAPAEGPTAPPMKAVAAPASSPQADTLISESETPSATVVGGKPGTFSRPVAGPVISSYGDKPNGLHNDGINIRAAKGAPVKAAAGGEVVYASNQLKGFGNLVLIRHPDRWLTAYAHLDTLAVKRGDEVARGQPIGTVGQTGDVDSPQLHFEIRRGTEALNPAAFLSAS